jgi:hypothetical protein
LRMVWGGVGMGLWLCFWMGEVGSWEREGCEGRGTETVGELGKNWEWRS